MNLYYVGDSHFFDSLSAYPHTDCGINPNTTSIVVNVRADFTGHPTISPRVLMNNAKWNLCLEDDARRQRGEADPCWYSADQTFDQVQVNSINAANVVDGKWYVVVKGDYAGRVSGYIYDITNATNPQQIPTTVRTHLSLTCQSSCCYLLDPYPHLSICLPDP